MRRLCALALALTLQGCASWQSALNPQGPQAGAIGGLFWLFVAVCGTIWALVILTLAVSARRRGRLADLPREPNAGGERARAVIVGVCVALTVVVISALTFASYRATRGLSGPPEDALSIRLSGYQFWWEATYPDAEPTKTFKTANELHVPVGRPVRIELQAKDVIHSFWVPSLAGKLDLIPGRDNAVAIRADRPGVYRGQCAEFCGLQHAHMAFLIIADPPGEFAAWEEAQRRDAATPQDDEAKAGAEVFLKKPCASCHTIQGTPAAGTLGPDLTHVAGRRYIAAGLAPTTRGSLAAWIADPQTMKPGNNMPFVPLSPLELRQVSAYLAGLQ